MKKSKFVKKSWDGSWDKVYQKQEWSKYPPEELIRFVARNFYKKPKRNQIKILDVGCGTGACTWYLAREGFSAYGVDGSKVAITKAAERFRKERLKANLQVMDLIDLNFSENYFDAVIDVVSISQNSLENSQKIIKELKRVTKPKGKIFSMVAGRGSNFKSFTNKGTQHLYSLGEIKKLFKLFQPIIIDESIRTENDRKYQVKLWVVQN